MQNKRVASVRACIEMETTKRVLPGQNLPATRDGLLFVGISLSLVSDEPNLLEEGQFVFRVPILGDASVGDPIDVGCENSRRGIIIEVDATRAGPCIASVGCC